MTLEKEACGGFSGRSKVRIIVGKREKYFVHFVTRNISLTFLGEVGKIEEVNKSKKVET